jgi:hypothetical protein
MRTVEAKLADWHRLYKELAQAQSRLAQGDTLVEDEVARLKRDCDAALDVVHSLLYRRARGAGTAPGNAKPQQRDLLAS